MPRFLEADAIYLHPDTGLHAYWIGQSTQRIEDAIYQWRMTQLMDTVKTRIDEAIEEEE